MKHSAAGIPLGTGFREAVGWPLGLQDARMTRATRRVLSMLSPRNRRNAVAFAIAASMQMLSGCHPAMTSPVSHNASAQAVDHTPSGTVADWPLRFKRHLFGAVCFDTRGCAILYDGRDHGTAADTPSASSIPSQRRDALMIARYGDLANFPAPAQLRWRTQDGSELTAEVDLAGIFGDGLIRHNVPREDIAEGVSMGFTHVLIEVNDRTVNVYTRTLIPTKREQVPGNKHSQFRDDLIKVYSRSY
jgi:hypothetical protein